MSDSPVDRFKRWMESEGLTHREAAKRLGCDATYPSMIISRGRVGLDVAVRIEEETADFAEGPIKCGEWVRHSETVAAPVATVQGAASIEQLRTIVALCDVADRDGTAKASVMS